MSRRIRAEGKVYVVPDDATDDEINQIVGPPAATPAATAAPSGPHGFGESFMAAQPIHPIDAINSLHSPTGFNEAFNGDGKPKLNPFTDPNVAALPPQGDLAAPFSQALGQVKQDDYTGAGGTLAGGVVLPWMAGKVASSVPGAVSRVAGEAPGVVGKVVRAGIKTFVPGGRTALKAYDFVNNLKEGDAVPTPPAQVSPSAPGLSPGILDSISQWKTGKPFNQLTPDEIKVVTELAGRVKPRAQAAPVQPVSPLPPPPGSPVVGLQPGQMAVKQHQVLSNVDQAIENKVANIHDYLIKNGITNADVLDNMTPEQLNQLAKDAHAHGKAAGNPVPKYGYKGLEGDSLQMVKDRLRGIKPQSSGPSGLPPPPSTQPSPTI